MTEDTSRTAASATTRVPHRPWSTALLAVHLAQTALVLAGGVVRTVAEGASVATGTAATTVAAALPAGMALWVAVGRRRADTGRPRALRDAAVVGLTVAAILAIVQVASLAQVIAGLTVLEVVHGLAVLAVTITVAGLALRTASTTTV
jgi:hypothetical protein